MKPTHFKVALFFLVFAGFVLFLFGTSPTVSAQNSESGLLEPVKWKTSYEELSNDTVQLIFTAEIDDKWNVYSQFTDEGGPVPTTIYFDSIAGAEIIGEAVEYGHKKEGPDPLFAGANVIKYLGDEDFVMKQKVLVTDRSKFIVGAVEYMTCDDARCLPPTFHDFSFSFTDKQFVKKLVGTPIDQTNSNIQATLSEPIGDCGSVQEISQNYFMTFIFGFLGGLLALLTPCVFPMIPLTVSFFTKDTKRSGFVNGIIYGASIIVIYVFIGLLITILFGAEALNALSVNWIANTLFFIVFVIFAFSFFGYYEITLPSSWSNKSDAMADKGGLIGIFFMAFTLSIVSFSCTGPIIGSAIVQAASTGSYLGPAIVMLGFSMALAIPFGLFAAFPSWLNSLPRSGSWMTSVKVVLGFLELALAFKFLSVADMTKHWNILKYEPFLIIWIIIAALMTLYLFGFIRFPHDSKLKKLKPTRLAFAGVSLATLIYLCTGFMMNEKTGLYKGLSIFSGILPPTSYNLWLEKPELDPAIKAEFPSYTLCANNIPCFKEYEEGLAYAKRVGKPIFKDFTGYGCVNCRKTEDKIWIQDEIYAALKNDWVLLSLYCDDKKDLKEQLVSIPRQVEMKNVGNKWADFQIVNYNKNAQPLYIMMTPDEELLGHPRGYYESVKDYKKFMDCGMAAFESSKN